MREIKVSVGGVHIPEGYVRIWLASKEDFFTMMEEDAIYFNDNGTLIVLGEGMVYLYMVRDNE